MMWDGDVTMGEPFDAVHLDADITGHRCECWIDSTKGVVMVPEASNGEIVGELEFSPGLRVAINGLAAVDRSEVLAFARDVAAEAIAPFE
ncbi:MAG TPA: hypothetical protein VH062_17540 [Polyangiaceae bacterium]|jgi:hypothetical protein|nr:hypothetical protein [Polyangiaceae bacterium]